ncbi:proteasome subunit beta [Actinoalloteichus spitiensis]|uniref:proteasome subunit beta n=1 Tax=Actinoalloteichus spitiensis TaxID=252394 RepID=UPI000369E873|nr:proteasome subunit beta [Actinoalloteichus spitiensis]
MENPTARAQSGAALPNAYFAPGSSFVDFVRAAAPELLPGNRVVPEGQVGHPPHGTTVVALKYRGGVLLAGDRRATAGNLIVQRDIEKVFPADAYSAVAIAGTAGIALELVRLFTVELQHYEKIHGVPLSLEGKANQLSNMIRGNLELAMAGLAVVPLFVGIDVDSDGTEWPGRIFNYDVTGGRYEEHGSYHAVGSGSLFAKSALKKRHERDVDEDTAVRNAVEALYDAADDDTATGHPDLGRKIYPVVVTITPEHGAVRLSDERTSSVAEAVVAARRDNPGG